MIFWLLVSVFPFAMIYAAVSDVMTMTIGNRLCLALAVAFFPLAVQAGLPAETIAFHAGVGLAALVAGIALFGFGLLGGGDAKLMAVTVLWLGPTLLMPYLVYSALLGLPLVFGLLWCRSAMPPVTGIAFADRLLGEKEGVPYGVALGAGALLVYGESVLVKAALASL